MKPHYTHRMFTMLTGITIGNYIRNRRLSLAGIEILETKNKIIDIALKYGYENPTSFTKAFSRFHGVAPSVIRKKIAAKLKLFNPFVIKLHIEGGSGMEYKIIDIKEEKFIAIAKDFRNEIVNEEGNHEIHDFWDECYKKGILDELKSFNKNNDKIYGLCSCVNSVEGKFKYGIGVKINKDTKELDFDELIKGGYIIWEVPASKYVVFECFGDNPNSIGEAWSYFYKEFLPQTGYKVNESTDYEVYYENSKEGLFCDLYIPIKK